MESTTLTQMSISSPVFEHNGFIPVVYTCDGTGVNPPIHIGNFPEGTITLALIVEDPDAPKGTYDHWIVWNIKPISEIEENMNPGTSGSNSSGKTGYHPPCPPDKLHHYHFHLFALDNELNLHLGASRKQLEDAMAGHILGQATLTGKYERSSKE